MDKSSTSDRSTSCEGASDSPAKMGLTPKKASLICQCARAEVTLDLAVIQVTSACRGCIHGMLDWHGCQGEAITLSLLQVKPGYTIVNDVCEGPEMFKQLCWKLKTVNGQRDASAYQIHRGDRVVLESPRWALERLAKRSQLNTSAAPSTADLGTLEEDQGAVKEEPTLLQAFPAAVKLPTQPEGPLDSSDEAPREMSPLEGRMKANERFVPGIHFRRGGPLASESSGPSGHQEWTSSTQFPRRRRPVVPPLDFSRLPQSQASMSRSGSVFALFQFFPSCYAVGYD